MGTRTIRELSTWYMNESDSDVLTRIACHQSEDMQRCVTAGDPTFGTKEPLEIYNRGYGFLIRLPPQDLSVETLENIWDDCEEEGISTTLIKNLRLIAEEEGADWVLLDPDVEKEPQLKPGRWK